MLFLNFEYPIHKVTMMYFKSIFAVMFLTLLVVGFPGNQNHFASAKNRDKEIIAFQNVNLVPMTSDKIIEHQTA